MPIIHWFRRDFRLHDNTALWHAARDAPDGIVIPTFIVDDAILGHPDTGGPIVAFMLACLGELRESLRKLGGDLVVLRGRPLDQLRALAVASGATAVYFNKDYAPSAVERDEEVERLLPATAGVAVRGFKDQVIFEEQEILAASSGEPYTVYTPYRKTWLARVAAEYGEEGPRVLAKPKLAFVPGAKDGSRISDLKSEISDLKSAIRGLESEIPDLKSEIPDLKFEIRDLTSEIRDLKSGIPTLNQIDLPTVASLGFAPPPPAEIPAGEAAGRRMLREFCAGPIRTYLATRNLPALATGTSRLSPHLRHGTLSPRQCLAAARAAAAEGGRAWAAGAEAWVGELVWREFYQQILFNFPEVAERPFKAKFASLRWLDAPEQFKWWCEGQTGFPIVDAAMRQLNATGWMHNRLRMIVAMFLTKDLLIDYRLGERYFMQHLIDGETAQNNGGWQWSASTGTDAQPWFRIFNPAAQGEKCDPEGTFVRRFCPELARVPARFIHAPHEMDAAAQRKAGCVIGNDYPAPRVDHAAARLRALGMFRGEKMTR